MNGVLVGFGRGFFKWGREASPPCAGRRGKGRLIIIGKQIGKHTNIRKTYEYYEYI